MKKPARGGLERFKMDGKWSSEEFSKAMAAHVTKPPLNERITALQHVDDKTYFSTIDDHGTMRFYEGPPPEGMPSVVETVVMARDGYFMTEGGGAVLRLYEGVPPPGLPSRIASAAEGLVLADHSGPSDTPAVAT